MTTVDVIFRFGGFPAEATALALGKLREVYGIGLVAVNEQDKTVRVEFDSTRLSVPVVQQLLRRTGLEVMDRVELTRPAPPPAPAPVPPTPAPQK